MSSQVGSAQVAIVPTLKGFRKKVTAETDASAKEGATGFKKLFSRAGDESGAAVGRGFKKSFEQQSSGFSDKTTKQLEADVTKAARALSAARLRQQDDAGKVTVAEAKLAEAQRKHAADSSQVISATERLNSATRRLDASNDVVRASSNDLRTAQEKLAAAADRAGTKLGAAGSRWGKKFRSGFAAVFGGVFFANIASSIAAGIGNALRTAITTVKDIVDQSIGSASNLEQSLGAVDAVFGDFSGKVHGYAQTAAVDVGLSQNAYNELATVVGAQLKNVGIPLDQVAGKTNDLVKLGADLSAQFGGPTSDALEAISALLRGERDPIEKYGVGFNEAAVQAEAFRLGIVKTTKDTSKITAAQARAEVAQRKYNDAVKKYGKNSTQALSAQATLASASSSLKKALAGTNEQLTTSQKAQATLSLLYKQTADSQGQFAAQSDTYAEKQQKQASLWENLKAKIGNVFLPVMSQLSDLMSNTVIPTISKLVDEQGPALTKAFEDAIPALTDLAKNLLPLLPGLLEAVAGAIPAISGVLQVLVPVLSELVKYTLGWWTAAGLLFELFTGTKSLDEFATKMVGISGVWGLVAQAANNTGLMIRHSVLTVVSWFNYLVTSAQATADLLAGRITFDEWKAKLAQLPNPVKDAADGVKKAAASLGTNLAMGMKAGIAASSAAVTAAATALAASAKAAAERTLKIKSPSRVFRDIGLYVGEGFVQGLKGSESKVQSASSSMVDKIRKAVDAKAITKAAGNSTIAAIKSTTARIVAVLGQREKVLDRLKDAQDKLADLVKQRADFIASTSASLVSRGDISSARSVTSMVTNLTKQIAAAAKFRETLDQLMKLGLDATSRDQLLQGFLQTGSTTAAETLLKGGADAVRQIADLQSQLAGEGNALGSQVGDAMYKAGIDAAAGLVKGLQSQADALTKVAEKLADDLVKTVKKKLGIKSPSRVMAALGRFTGQGFTGGVKDQIPVAQRALTDLIRVPSPTRASVAAAGAGAASSAPTAPADVSPMDLSDATILRLARALAAVLRPQSRQGVPVSG